MKSTIQNGMSTLKRLSTKIFIKLAPTIFFLVVTSNNIFANTTLITTKMTAWKADVLAVLQGATAVLVIGGGFLCFMQYMQGSNEAPKNFTKLIIGIAIMGLIDLIAAVFLTA